MKRLITKTVIGTAVLIIIGAAMSMIFNSAIINNYIAMGQMSNNNEAYLVMEYYNKFKVITGTVYGLFFVLFAGKTIYSFYKVTKEKRR